MGDIGLMEIAVGVAIIVFQIIWLSASRSSFKVRR